MGKYKVQFSRTGERDLRKLNNQLYERFKKRVITLSNNPRPRGTRKLLGEENRYRIRIGDYRVLFHLDDKKQTLTIYRIAHRNEVYR